MASPRAFASTALLALLALSLAGHFVADATCRPSAWAASATAQCGSSTRLAAAGGEQITSHQLHLGALAPALASIIVPLALGFSLPALGLSPLRAFLSPPAQPPRP